MRRQDNHGVGTGSLGPVEGNTYGTTRRKLIDVKFVRLPVWGAFFVKTSI
ncbi:hypothetical protein [Brevibacillus laterosporus]|nr:hypothetical protein [Brevibacillus laterosporus]